MQKANIYYKGKVEMENGLVDPKLPSIIKVIYNNNLHLSPHLVGKMIETDIFHSVKRVAKMEFESH